MIVLLIVAILPPLYMMRLVYLQDQVEREPFGLVAHILLLGMIAVIPISIAEMILSLLIGGIFHDYTAYVLIENFIGVALVEELGKYLAARKVWNKRDFNYRFDGVVYCAAASLGFALVENILYVVQNGIGTGISRAIFSIPGHTIFGIAMGIFFGEAKYQEALGNQAGSQASIRLSLIIPILIHGSYDALLSFEGNLFTVLFFIFILCMDVIAIRKVKQFEAQDKPFRAFPGE